MNNKMNKSVTVYSHEQDEILFRIGERITTIRNHRKLSQVELCQLCRDEHDLEAFSRTTLQRIETGKPVMLSAYLAVLKTLDVHPSVFFESLMKEEEIRETILTMFSNMKYEQAEDYIKKVSHQMTTVRQKQFILWVRGVLKHRLHQDTVGAEILLLKALEMTLPKAVDRQLKKPRLNLKTFDRLAVNIFEFRICSSLADLKPTAEYLEMAEYLITKIQSNKLMSKQERSHRLCQLQFNISVELLDAYQATGVLDERILDVCDYVIQQEKSTGRYYWIGKVYYNLGRYYSHNKDSKNAKAFFQRSYIFWLSIGDLDKAEKTLKWVLEKYDIALDTVVT